MEKFKLFFIDMKAKLLLTALTITFFLIPVSANALTIFETTGWIIGEDSLNFEFTADQAPYTYLATLTDLSEDPFFGFEVLSLSITMASSEILGSISGSGSFIFPVESGYTYYANVSGIGIGTQDAGLFGLEVSTTTSPVPSPAAIWLVGSGLVGFGGYFKRKILSAKY